MDETIKFLPVKQTFQLDVSEQPTSMKVQQLDMERRITVEIMMEKTIFPHRLFWTFLLMKTI